MPRGCGHDPEHFFYECIRNLRVEQVAHRIDEYQAWCSPVFGKRQKVTVTVNAESWSTRIW